MTIWYDFTTSRRNRGRNGIANVEWSFGKALLAHHEHDVRCFALDERSGLVEIDPNRELSDLVYARPAATATLPAPLHRSLRQRVRSTVIVALGDNADAVQPAVTSVLRRIRRLLSGSRSAVRRMLPSARSAPRLNARVTSHDVVISLGADWSGELADLLTDLKRSTGCGVVTMVYDLIPLSHTHLAFHADRDLFAAYYRRILSVSDLICCISPQTQRDLLDFAASQRLGAPATAFLRLGDGAAVPDVRDRERGDFFLVVGTIERRKNVELLYDALRILESRGAELPTVVIAGAVGWGVDDFIHEVSVRATEASRSIVMLGAVDDDTLDSLYLRARALLFPSHYEGWGLPLREAAVRGCPIAAGDSPAAREALGDYPGAAVLPADDAGPWAEFMTTAHPPSAPADFHPWSATVQQLLAMIEPVPGSGSAAQATR